MRPDAASPPVAPRPWGAAPARAAACVALGLGACRSAPAPAITPRGAAVAALAGEYELVRIGTQRLPANTNGRVTMLAGHLSLGRDLRYVRTDRYRLCLLGRCETQTGVERGTWLLLHDGGLYLDSERGYTWPPPLIAADGREVRLHVVTGPEFTHVYERR